MNLKKFSESVKILNSMLNDMGIRKQGAKENFAKHIKPVTSNYEESKELQKQARIESKIKRNEKKTRKDRKFTLILQGVKDEIKELLSTGANNEFDIFDHIKFS